MDENNFFEKLGLKAFSDNYYRQPAIGFWHMRRRCNIVIIMRDINQINTYVFIHFNVGDENWEPNSLRELFLSLKSDGDTNPALFKLCRPRDFRPYLGVLRFRFSLRSYTCVSFQTF